MTKRQYIDRYFEIAKQGEELTPRLDKLVEEDRITTGAAYSIYIWYQWYGYKAITEIINKAGKAKNYTRYIKRINSWHWNHYIGNMEKNYQETLDFIIEQENLPFEQTQKQVLKANGELKEQ